MPRDVSTAANDQPVARARLADQLFTQFVQQMIRRRGPPMLCRILARRAVDTAVHARRGRAHVQRWFRARSNGEGGHCAQRAVTVFQDARLHAVDHSHHDASILLERADVWRDRDAVSPLHDHRDMKGQRVVMLHAVRCREDHDSGGMQRIEVRSRYFTFNSGTGALEFLEFR